MTTAPTIQAPGSFAPETAIVFGSRGGVATPVDPANPLPIRTLMTASSAAPLAGSASASGTVGPFMPELGRPIRLVLSGNWSGTVQLLRSTDGGATKLPITYADGSPRGSWTGNVNAAVAEESVAGAAYYLGLTLGSGSVGYRMEQ